MRPELTAEVRAALDQVVRGDLVAGSPSRDWPGAFTGGQRIRLQRVDFPIPEMLLWFFSDYIEAPNAGWGEKLAWRVCFTFKGHRCGLALQKFGLRLYVDQGDGEESEAVGAMVEDLQRRLIAVLKVVGRQAFAPFAEAQLDAGRLTIINQAGDLRGMYEYFRDLAEIRIEHQDDRPTSLSDVLSRWSQDRIAQQQRFFNAVAMITAYFSWLEHVLVLCRPLVELRPAPSMMRDFIRMRWREKYQSAFDVSAPGSAKAVHDGLHEIAEEYRHTYSHGGFDKRDGASDLGAMPAVWNEARSVGLLGPPLGDRPTVEAVTKTLDAADEWLRTGPARFGMRYAESGLDLPLDAAHLDRAFDAMATQGDFDGWLDGYSSQLDRHVNMDW